MFSKKTQVEPKASLLTEDEKREFRGIDFPFENLAMEGGGSKGLSYVGVVRVSYRSVYQGRLDGRTMEYKLTNELMVKRFIS